MKVFVSWSGPTSRTMAHALKGWLQFVLPAVQTFVSDQDIAAGDRWDITLASELKNDCVAIFCVTPFNLKSTWLNFEAGAVSNSACRVHVIPLLLGVDRSTVQAQGPLSQFQSKLFIKEEMLELLSSLNNFLPAEEAPLCKERLNQTFEICWPQLKENLEGLVDGAQSETETGYPWFFTSKDLERREFDPSAKSVWVITPWPYQDVQLACLVNTLRRNIGLGVKYTFMIPRDPTGQSRKVLHDMFAGRILVHEVEEDKFESLAVTHYVVLNPEYENACSPRVFLEIPTKERGYWIETSPEAAIKFTNRFRQMIPPDPCVVVPMATCSTMGTEAAPS